MVKIRLSRAGAKKRPFYHIVVTDGRSSRDGRFIERLGFYNPIATVTRSVCASTRERVGYWRSNGAQTTASVAKLLRQVRGLSPTARL